MVAMAFAFAASAADPSMIEVIEVPGDIQDLLTALDVAQEGDTIEIAAGTYTGDGNRDLVCEETVTIRGAGAGATVFELGGEPGNETRWMSLVAGSRAVIEDLSVRGAYAGFSIGATGAVLHVSDGAAPMITGCEFSNNVAETSGAVVWSELAPQVPATYFADCEFHGNAAWFAAVVFGNASFERCTFISNRTSAVTAVGKGPLAMRDCLLAGNFCADPLSTTLAIDGGWGRMIEGVTVRDNDTYYGICMFGGSVSEPVPLYRCTVYNHPVNLSVG
jgi:hypothetical protein